jgi:hypothetical protein
MKKTFFIYSISFFFIIISLFIITQLETNPPEKTLLGIFSISDARVVSSEICFSGRIDNSKFKSIDDLRKLVVEISKESGVINDGLPGEVVKNDNMEGIELDGAIDDNRNIHISAINSMLPGDTKGSYINMSIVDNSSKPKLEETRNSILGILGKYRIKPKVNSCITGCYNGKLDNNKLNDICFNIFKEANANKVEGIRDNNLISVSAYTAAIGESVEVNGKKVNLNIAVRYNSYENKTYIWLATPVITTEY